MSPLTIDRTIELMPKLIVEPHLADPDGFYEALIDMHRALDDDESQRCQRNRETGQA